MNQETLNVADESEGPLTASEFLNLMFEMIQESTPADGSPFPVVAFKSLHDDKDVIWYITIGSVEYKSSGRLN